MCATTQLAAGGRFGHLLMDGAVELSLEGYYKMDGLLSCKGGGFFDDLEGNWESQVT